MCGAVSMQVQLQRDLDGCWGALQHTSRRACSCVTPTAVLYPDEYLIFTVSAHVQLNVQGQTLQIAVVSPPTVLEVLL